MNNWSSTVDSSVVLLGQTILYTVYVLFIISLVAWFATRLTKERKGGAISSKIFYGWVILLIAIGVSIHLVTYNTIPWVKDDLERPADVAETYDLTIGNHEWTIPGGQMRVPCNELVKFSVTSEDLTYGFGIFRENNTMVAQMQVVPGHSNDLLWKFTKNETFYILSTEYSGPLGSDIRVDNAIVVYGCQ